MFNDYYTDEMRLRRANGRTIALTTIAVVTAVIVFVWYLGQQASLLVEFMDVYADLSV